MTLYGNESNMLEAIMSNKDQHHATKDFATTIIRKDMMIIDEALHLIEKYKKLGVNDYDDLMKWIIGIEL